MIETPLPPAQFFNPLCDYLMNSLTAKPQTSADRLYGGCGLSKSKPSFNDGSLDLREAVQVYRIPMDRRDSAVDILGDRLWIGRRLAGFVSREGLADLAANDRPCIGAEFKAARRIEIQTCQIEPDHRLLQGFILRK